MTITLNENINSSLQVGDMLYYVKVDVGGETLNTTLLENTQDPILIGKVVEIDGKTITTEETAATPRRGDFLMFVKDNRVNTSGLKGYYAEARLKLRTNKSGKLFSVSAEVSESSK